MSIKKEKQENKSLDKHEVEDKDLKHNSREIEFNYPGKVTIKAKSKKEADEKFKKLNNK